MVRALFAPFRQRLSGDGFGARAFRGSILTAISFGGENVLRLAGNLVLTRILFPEAFGLMALVMTVIQGLAMFSDVGVTPAILQSKRGDDRDFLNTAWTIQAIRGAGLWVVACLLAWPLSIFYDAPLLAQMLPVAGITLLIQGFNPTALDTANRHLKLGRVSAIEVGVQIVGIASAIFLAWLWGTVWALVASGIISQCTHYLMLRFLLPRSDNRFRWEKAAADELMTFGRWIFLSTICGFFYTQGDKIILGRWLPIDTFGIYNIAYFLASVPLLLGGVVVRKVLIPVYRDAPPSESQENFLRLRRARWGVSLILLALMTFASLLGVWAVELLYDPRYGLAGPVIVLLALMQLPQIIVLTYDQAVLASGDSRSYFGIALARAAVTVICLVAGLELLGLFGAILAQGAAGVLTYPFVARAARRVGAWDATHDLGAALCGLGLVAFALWWNWAAVLALAAG